MKKHILFLLPLLVPVFGVYWGCKVAERGYMETIGGAILAVAAASYQAIWIVLIATCV